MPIGGQIRTGSYAPNRIWMSAESRATRKGEQFLQDFVEVSIAFSCGRCGRSPERVDLVEAISKFADEVAIRQTTRSRVVAQSWLLGEFTSSHGLLKLRTIAIALPRRLTAVAPLEEFSIGSHSGPLLLGYAKLGSGLSPLGLETSKIELMLDTQEPSWTMYLFDQSLGGLTGFVQGEVIEAKPLVPVVAADQFAIEAMTAAQEEQDRNAQAEIENSRLNPRLFHDVDEE